MHSLETIVFLNNQAAIGELAIRHAKGTARAPDTWIDYRESFPNVETPKPSRMRPYAFALAIGAMGALAFVALAIRSIL